MLDVFIGWDSREVPAYEVAKHSLIRNSSVPVNVFPLVRKSLEMQGEYYRLIHKVGAQCFDAIDGRPFSTEFSFTRFLTPILAKKMGRTGRVLFVDCDFLFLGDVAELLEADMQGAPVAVVKQIYEPNTPTKMDGQLQQSYPCKLWSSLMLFDLQQELPLLTNEAVSTKPGSWLHQFQWAPSVGELDPKWNCLPGSPETAPKAVHYTEGIPLFAGYEYKPWASEWKREAAMIEKTGSTSVVR